MTRWAHTYSQGRIVIMPSRVFGQATVGDSRLPASAVAEMYWYHGLDETIRMWDYLTAPDVQLACWWVATYGTRTWKKRFKEWTTEYSMALWYQVEVPMPPCGKAKG